MASPQNIVDESMLAQYRATEREQGRTASLLNLLPSGRNSVLDVGAREGHFSRLLAESFERVVALDLVKPPFEYPGIETVAGDATDLKFADGAFDCVFCAEVLEHIPQVEKACREIARVAKHEVVIGVPYNQDLRFSRCLCVACGKRGPAWGHVNSFDEQKLISLFPTMRHVTTELVGTRYQRTTALTSLLWDLGGNPWGTYYQDEPCIHCGAKLVKPQITNPLQKLSAATAAVVDAFLSRAAKPQANWIHILFSKD